MAFREKTVGIPRHGSPRFEKVWISLLFAGLFALTCFLFWVSVLALLDFARAISRGGVDLLGVLSGALGLVFALGLSTATGLVAVGGSFVDLAPKRESEVSLVWRLLAYVAFAVFVCAAAWVVLSVVFVQARGLILSWNALGSWGILVSLVFLLLGLAATGGFLLLANVARRGFEAHYRADFRGEMLPRFRELRRSLHLIRQSPLTMAGLILIVGLVVVALLAQFAPALIAPFPQDAGAVYYPTIVSQPPSFQHVFGTDELGRDYFSRVVLATPLDLQISMLVVGSALIIGIILGIIAGFKGGWIDELIMRVTDIFLSIPGLILAIAFSAALGGGIVNVMIALIIVWWPGYTRIIRAQTLSIRESLYIEAARAVGSKTGRIIFRHVLPNALAPVLVNSTLDLGSVIIVAAALGYLGLGQPPPWPEWGRLIADGQNTVLRGEWWLATFPGLAILVTSLSFNLVGDGLRDILDPRLRR